MIGEDKRKRTRTIEFTARFIRIRVRSFTNGKANKDLVVFDLTNCDLKYLKISNDSLELEKGKIYKFKCFLDDHVLIDFEKIS